ncbi:GntR family transcriptional regulator [Spiroplasma culicicola]|nr:GntR family transcriptional regulator [Spiroplasma culicicola]
MSDQHINKTIEQYLLEIIQNEKVDLSKPLPSENFLATKFKTSRQTARIELSKLLHKGFIKAKKGSGYYINPHINWVTMTSIGKKYKHNQKEVSEIDLSILKNIIEKNNYILIDNIEDYYGYRKIFYNDINESILYINSFILKSKFKTINLDHIKNSLIDFIDFNNIELDNQINNIKLEIPNEVDKTILNYNDIQKVPVVYGIVCSKDNDIIEIFERHYRQEYFELSFSKIV